MKIKKLDSHQNSAIIELLGIIFWKDYKANYIDVDRKFDFTNLIDEAEIKGPEGEEYTYQDLDKMIDLANKIRTKIGLPKLSNEGNYLYEAGNNRPE